MHGLNYTSLSSFFFFSTAKIQRAQWWLIDLGLLGFNNATTSLSLEKQTATASLQPPASSLQPPNASEWRGGHPTGAVAGSDRALQLVAASVGPKFVVLGWKQA